MHISDSHEVLWIKASLRQAAKRETKKLNNFSMFLLTMKKFRALIPILIFVLQSCNIFYHRVHFEHLHKQNAIVTKETKVRNTGSTCRSKEITTEKDSLTNLVTLKEVITYDCKGAYSNEVKRKTWTRVHGKKNVTVSKK